VMLDAMKRVRVTGVSVVAADGSIGYQDLRIELHKSAAGVNELWFKCLDGLYVPVADWPAVRDAVDLLLGASNAVPDGLAANEKKAAEGLGAVMAKNLRKELEEKFKVLPVKKKAAGPVVKGGTLIDRVREVMADGVTRTVKDVAKELGEPNSYRVAQALATYKTEFERVGKGVYLLIGGPVGGGQARNKMGAAAPVVKEKKAAPGESKADPSQVMEEDYKALRITPVGLLSEEQLKRRMKLAAAIGEADPDARSEFLKRGAQS